MKFFALGRLCIERRMHDFREIYLIISTIRILRIIFQLIGVKTRSRQNPLPQNGFGVTYLRGESHEFGPDFVGIEFEKQIEKQKKIMT